MASKLEEIYDWNTSLVEKLHQDLDESLMHIQEIKTIEIHEDKVTTEVYALVKISGGNLKKEYTIKIRVPKEYPNTLPECFEISNNLPKGNLDAGNRHITYKDIPGFEFSIKNSFCMISPFRIHSYFGNNEKDIYNTINLLLIDFLEIQELFDQGKHIDGYGHGSRGLMESFNELFNTNSLIEAYDICKAGVEGKLKPGKTCFCLSGKKIHDCHLNIMWTALNIDFNNQHIYNFIKELADKIKNGATSL